MKEMVVWAMLVLFGWGGMASAEMIDNGDGTVTDTETGLMWQQKTATETDAPALGWVAGRLDWEDALRYCETLSLAGHDDWRLPDRNELQSLVDYAAYLPAIDKTAFPDTLSAVYWSSTSNVVMPNLAWYLHFGDGAIHFDNKVNWYFVQAVRGG